MRTNTPGNELRLINLHLKLECSSFVDLTLLRGPRRHHVLVPDSMRTGGQGQVAGRRVRPLPEWHRDRELGSGWVVLQLRLSLQHCSVWKSAHFQYNSQETVTRVTIDMSGNNKIQLIGKCKGCHIIFCMTWRQHWVSAFTACLNNQTKIMNFHALKLS